MRLSLYSASFCGGAEELRALKERAGHLAPWASGKISRSGADGTLGALIRARMFADCSASGREEACGEHGKPFLPGRRDVAYNISHSSGLAVGAMLVRDTCEAETGAGFSVGVDVERVDRENTARHERIARRFFTEAERAAILSAADPAFGFYLTWTRKEAYLKYTGEGISRSLAETDTTALNGVSFHSRVINNGGEYVLTVCVPAGFAGAEKAEVKEIL